MKRSVTIPHLTGDDSNKLNQLTKWAQSLGHPVFYDNREGHITPMQILEMYDEAQSPSNPKPLVKIFYNSDESQHVRRNPSKPGKRKTAARDKYMANLLGGKNGNDLLNLASKVGSRKAAVTLLKSGNTKTPYNVEMPLGDEDEIQSLRMQGLTPSLDALVDEGFRSKLEKTIKGYLGEDIKIKDVDKGVLITDESIEDFRQMLTVYHLAHQMNGPLANAIKGHVPRKDADLFDRLIPTFDDILAGENLVLFAHNIVQPPESNNTNFIVEDQDTLLPPWLSLAEPNDESLAELRSSLTQRDVETFMQILAGGDLRGAFNKALSVARTQLQRPFLWVFGLRTLQQDDRQARLFDDLIENITDGLVSDYGRGRGYTDRKELAKAVMHSSSEVFDRRLTSAFAPLKITVNAARRVRKFSRSGVNVRMLLDLNTVNAGDFDDRDPSVAQIEPGMYYLGNYDFRIPPIGWNRKWMNATAQIIHEYWNFITPNDDHTANDGFLSNRSKRNKSLTLPQLLYLIGIRTKELYNYDLPPEEWLVVLQVLGGKNALTDNYYSGDTTELETQFQEDMVALRSALQQQISDYNFQLTGIEARQNPSALPHTREKQQNKVSELIKTHTEKMKGITGEIAKLSEYSFTARVENSKRYKDIQKQVKDLEKKLENTSKKVEEVKTDTSISVEEKEETIEELLEEIGRAHEEVEIISGGVELPETTINSEVPTMIDLPNAPLALIQKHTPRTMKKPDAKRLSDEKGWVDAQPYDEHNLNEKGKKDYPAGSFGMNQNFPPPLNPVLYLGDTGKIVVIGDTHADHISNNAILDHAQKKYSDAKHVVWLGDTVDGGRGNGRLANWKKYVKLEDDETNLQLIEDLVSTDPHKYIPIQGNHERYFLAGAMSPAPYWEALRNRDGVRAMLEQELKFSHRPLVIIAGTTVMMHGGFPYIKGKTRTNQAGNEVGKNEYHETDIGNLSLEEVTTRQVLTDEKQKQILWNRIETGDLNKPLENWKIQMLQIGMQTQIVAHTPGIARAALGQRRGGLDRNHPMHSDHHIPTALEQGIAYADDDFVLASLQSNCGTSKHTKKHIEYFVLDLDNNELIIEEFGFGGRMPSEKSILQHEHTSKITLPTPKLAKRNPMNCGCGQTPCKTYGTRRNPTIPMYVGTPTGRVKNLGSITAIVQVGRNIIKDVGEGIQDIYRSLIGGRQSMTEKRMAMAVAEMQADLERECLELGGNVVGNIQIDYEYPATGSDITLIAVADAFKTPKKNPASNYHKYEKKVISILKKEGGAAGLKALKPAFPKGTTKAKVVGMLQKMNHVVLHQDGDYILIQGLNNPDEDEDPSVPGIHRFTPPTAQGSQGARKDPSRFAKDTLGKADMSRLKTDDPAPLDMKPRKKKPKKNHPDEDEDPSVPGIHRFTPPTAQGSQGARKDPSRFAKDTLGKADMSRLKTDDPAPLDMKPRKKKPKKNHPELVCIYKKSSRSKPCGSPLREKKNPKGRYACRKCGAEYEMR